MLDSPLNSLLGIDCPVLQGGMAWVADGVLAAAVSNGGGLGIIGAGNAAPEEVRREIRQARALTQRPFGLNIMLLSPHAPAIASLALEEGVAVVTTGAGSPAPYMAAWLEADIKVLPVVASVALAKKMARSGASAVIAEGTESGGHIGELATMALIPQIVDAVDIPVIAAGGIADGRGLAAALMLGACGIQAGTVFLAASECRIHANYKARLLKAGDIDTVVTGRRLGHPVRSLRSPFSRAYVQAEQAGASDEELEALGSGALRLAVQEGDAEKGCFIAGQCAGLVKEERSAAAIIASLCAEAEVLLKGAPAWVK